MPPTLEAVEQRFAAQTNAFHGELVDLNKSMSAVNQKLSSLLSLRNQLMGMYGVPPDPKWMPPAPKAAAKPTPPQKAKAKAKAAVVKPPSAQTVAASLKAAEALAAAIIPGGEVDYKGRLNQALCKKVQKSLQKDEVVYKTEGETTTGFTSTLSSVHLSKEYSTPEPAPSKRAAEAAAAAAALKAEFPDAFANCGFQIWGRGQKRKAGGSQGIAELNSKSRLNACVQIVLSKPITKEDVVYETKETTDGEKKSYIATVTFPGWDKKKKFTGAAAASKVDAEKNAAEVALDKLDGVFKPAIEEHQVKKKQKKDEANEKRKKAREAKEAEGGDAAKPAAADKQPAAKKPAAKK